MSQVETARTLAKSSDRCMEPPEPGETFNPYSVVHVVFQHLAAQGLHPTLGTAGDPSIPAAELLRALGIRPSVAGDRRIAEEARQQLADLRSAFFDNP